MLCLQGSHGTKSSPSLIGGIVLKIHGRDRLFFPAIAAIGLALLAVQWSGGAWNAEFNGNPDESAQFVSGRMIWEYLTVLPRENPVNWAKQYYLHYPKVAIGHWPPGYHLAEAFWSLIFGSSRSSAMWLQWFIALVGLMGLYTLARPRFPLAVTCGIVGFAIATPVFQQGLQQTMSDLGCLLCSVFFIHAMLRLLKRPDPAAVYLVLLTLLAAAMMKGTAVCLVPVPVVALLVSGRRLSARSWGPVAVALGVMAACLVWYVSTSNVLAWSGLTSWNIPWPVANLGRLAGWGFLGLAALGLRFDDPLAIIAASMAGCAVLISYPIRAMNETRHWIIVLPAILLLAGYAVTRFDRRFSALLLVPAIALFPYARYHQTSAGCRDLIRQLHLPARILVSAGAEMEGALISEISIDERYPASLVARASKVLAVEGWNGDHYRLLALTPEAVAQRLDEFSLDVVILDSESAAMPHQVLLRDAMTNNPSWRPCGDSQSLVAYCRRMPPAFPRKPIVLDVGGWHLEERIDR